MSVKIEYEADDIYMLRISGILKQSVISGSARARAIRGGRANGLTQWIASCAPHGHRVC